MDDFIEVPCKSDFKAFIINNARVLSPDLQKKIDEIWYGEFQLRQGHLFNNYVLGIIDVSLNEILVEKVEYKLILAGLRDPSIINEINFKPLCTSGMTISDGKVLIGQRSQYVSTYPNAYEMVPSGSIDACQSNELVIDLRAQLFKEFVEEANIEEGFIEKSEGWTLIYDVTTKVYEVIARIYVQSFLSSSPIQKLEGEYRSLMWLDKDEFEKHLIQHSDHYVPLTKYLFTKWRDLI